MAWMYIVPFFELTSAYLKALLVSKTRARLDLTPQTFYRPNYMPLGLGSNDYVKWRSRLFRTFVLNTLSPIVAQQGN